MPPSIRAIRGDRFWIAGRLIGVTTAIFSPSGTSAGIGFAIPVDEVNRIVPQLIRNGHAVLPDVWALLGVQLDDNWTRSQKIAGVMIWKVRPNGPAAAAGLQGLRQTRTGWLAGDIIIALDGVRVQFRNDVYDALEKHAAGKNVKLKIRRGNQTLDFELTPGSAVDV